jgi:hypothetical protein
MTKTEALARIGQFINDVRASKGLAAMNITGDVALLGGDVGIDSLDLAAMVVDLQGENLHDPFREGFVNFNSADELAALFSDGHK